MNTISIRANKEAYMSNQITLEEISRTGVMELVDIALSLELPDRLHSIVGQDFTKEIGDLTPTERKIAVFIHYIGDLTVDESLAKKPGVGSQEAFEELLEHTNESPIGKRVNTLYAFLLFAIQVRHGLEVDGTQDVYWDAKGKIHIPLTSFMLNTDASALPN